MKWVGHVAHMNKQIHTFLLENLMRRYDLGDVDRGVRINIIIHLSEAGGAD
jgi:hypothetical protein